MDYYETCILPFLNRFFDDHAVPLPSEKEFLQIYGKVILYFYLHFGDGSDECTWQF